MRKYLPPYLVKAIDYVTGGYVPGAPVVPADQEDESEKEVIGLAGTEKAAPVAGR
ncbi:hypothetical protein D3C81_1223860 [compost metagenome]